jgi:thiamine-monophosphate kinase
MLSEDELIRIIRRTVKSRGRVRLGIGDDAAALRDGTVITTDAYAEGVHFNLSYMNLRQVGERCACGAISDVVAMAAEPEAVLVSLALPAKRGRGSGVGGRGTADDFRLQNADCRLQCGGGGKTNRQERQERQEPDGERLSAVGREPLALAVRELYRGIESVCRELGCEVAGGDIIVADQLMLALTVTGKTRTPKLRSGARPGDHLYVTGSLGAAEAGRFLLAEQVKSQKPKAKSQNGGEDEARLQIADCRLQIGRTGLSAVPRWARSLVSRHLRPMPRLGAMLALKSRIHGLIDTSDGLATDARHLCEMSGVRIVVDAEALPVLPGVSRFCAANGFDPLDFVLGAGEDYELLFTSRRLLSDTIGGVKVTRIGSVEKGRGLCIRRDGRVLPVTTSGYDHMRVDNDKTGC